MLFDLLPNLCCQLERERALVFTLQCGQKVRSITQRHVLIFQSVDVTRELAQNTLVWIVTNLKNCSDGIGLVACLHSIGECILGAV